MKRMRIDRASLEALYPPMDAAFERELRQRIAGLPAGKEKAMKKKTGFALVLAAALLLALAASALAAFAASQGFFADVARIQLEGGYYDGWTLEEKEQVVRLMKENGILTDAQAWDTALRETDAKQREAALDSLFAGRYGVNGRTDVIGVDSILIKEKGALETWSMEDKAWYSAMLEDIGLLGSDAEVYMLPDEGAISVLEAEQIAREAVISAYGLKSDALDGCTALVDCREYIDEVGVLPPYFLVELRRGENPLYWVCVSQQGRVLSSEDGYSSVTSPAEDAAEQKRRAALEAVPQEQRLAAHTDGLAALPVQTVELSQDAWIDGMTTLLDGTLLVYGYAQSAEGVLAGLEVEGKTPFALRMDEHGEVLWRTALEQQGCVTAAMELDGGDILLLIEEDTDDVEDRHYYQTRLDADGSAKETVLLPMTEEMTGIRCEYELLWASAGHGGFLLDGVAGARNIPFCVQLDEGGKPVFARTMEELGGMPVSVYAAQDGYIVAAWNRKSELPLLRWLDEEGNTVSESPADAALAGLGIVRILPCEDGSIIATASSGEAGDHRLLCIDANGGLRWQVQGRLDTGTNASRMGLVKLKRGYATLCRHDLPGDDTVMHRGLVLFGDDGHQVSELRLSPLEEDRNWRGSASLAAVGEWGLAVAVNVLEEDSADWSVSRNSCAVLIADTKRQK